MLLLIYKPLVCDSHLSGVCLAVVSRSMDFSGRWLPERFRTLLSLVRQWLHVRRQSTVAFGRISYFLREGYLEVHTRLALEI